jgi:ketosteroid isomerase-like protein
MAETNGEPKRRSVKFAARKIQFAADMPPSIDAKAALKSGIAGAAATVVALILAIAGVWWLRWIALLVWLIGLPFLIRAVLRGKFESDTIAAGRSPMRGKPLAMAGMFLGLGSAGLAVLCLLIVFIAAILPSPSLPGKYGNAERTFNEYMKAVRSGDFDAYLNCLESRRREGEDQTVQGTKEERRKAFTEKLRSAFEGLHKRRASQEVMIFGVEYSDGGTTARDANRADLRIRCVDKASGLATEVSMSMKRETDGWKVTSSEL